MSSATRYIERRQHQRYSVTDKTLAITFGGVGQLLELSAGGFSAKYFDVGFDPKIECSAEIMVRGSSLYVDEIPLKIIWVGKKDFIPFTSIFTQKVGVQFHELNDMKKQQIEDLVKFHRGVQPGSPEM